MTLILVILSVTPFIMTLILVILSLTPFIMTLILVILSVAKDLASEHRPRYNG